MPAARLPEVGPRIPRTHGPILSAFGRWVMRVTGWSFEGDFPNLPKFVLIVAPHTSNWDFPLGVAAKLALRLRAWYLGKDSLFKFPLGVLMRWLGGIPVDRSQPHDVVSRIVEEFRKRDQLILVVAPEGTRKRVERWRTGFYHIAHGVGVPILPVAFDWGTRTIRVGVPYTTSGDVERDLPELQRFYAGARGRRPENET